MSNGCTKQATYSLVRVLGSTTKITCGWTREVSHSNVSVVVSDFVTEGIIFRSIKISLARLCTYLQGRQGSCDPRRCSPRIVIPCLSIPFVFELGYYPFESMPDQGSNRKEFFHCLPPPLPWWRFSAFVLLLPWDSMLRPPTIAIGAMANLFQIGCYCYFGFPLCGWIDIGPSIVRRGLPI